MSPKQNQPELFVRTWVPSFAINNGDYSPRVIGHADSAALSDETLRTLFEEGVNTGRIDPEGADVCEEFEELLAGQNYRVFYLTNDAQGMFVARVDDEGTTDQTK